MVWCDLVLRNVRDVSNGHAVIVVGDGGGGVLMFLAHAGYIVGLQAVYI